VPGVFAAGDLAEPVRSVANAVGSGSRVGKAIALDLVRPLDHAPARDGRDGIVQAEAAAPLLM
jgi:hypothetical protein